MKLRISIHIVVVMSLVVWFGEAVVAQTADAVLVRSEVFVHEMPHITIKIMAAKDRPLKMWGKYGPGGHSLFIDLIDPQGKVERGVPSAPGFGYPVPLNLKDMITLKRGRTLEWTYAVLATPRKAGVYKVRVRWRPAKESKFLIDKMLPLKVIELPKDGIETRLRVRFDDPDETIELLKVKFRGKYILVHYWNRAEEKSIRLLVDLQQDSTFTATSATVHNRAQIWVVYSFDGALRALRLYAMTGTIKQQGPLNLLDEKTLEKKKIPDSKDEAFVKSIIAMGYRGGELALYDIKSSKGAGQLVRLCQAIIGIYGIDKAQQLIDDVIAEVKDKQQRDRIKKALKAVKDYIEAKAALEKLKKK